MTMQKKKQGDSKSIFSYKDGKLDERKEAFARNSMTGTFSFEREDTRHFLKYVEKNYRGGRKIGDLSAKSK